MCILDACCYCIFLDIGCMLIAALILIFRVIIIVLMFYNPNYMDVDISDGFSAIHVSIILAAFGCIIPVFLMWGVCTGNPNCVCSFITLEIVYVIVNLFWEMYFVIRFYSKGGMFNSYYDIPASYYGFHNDYDVYYYETHQDKYKTYIKDDYFWVGPVMFLGVEGYFIWVAYSYYRFLQDEYEYYDPRVFYA